MIETNVFDIEIIDRDGNATDMYGLVNATWPDKEVVQISEEAYHEMEDVGSAFYMRYYGLSYERTDGSYSDTRMAIYLAMGRFDGVLRKPLYEIQLDDLGYEDAAYASSSLLYAAESLKQMTESYQDKSKREKYIYKQEDIKSMISDKTLLIQKENLLPKLQYKDIIDELYPYDWKWATLEEIDEAWKNRDEDVLVMRYIDGGELQSIAIYHLESGQIVSRAYPCPWVTGVGGKIQKAFFKKMLL